MIFECGESPTVEWGEDAGVELYDRTFNTDNRNKNVFYQAVVSGSNDPFHTSKTPPTDEELQFQLERFDGGGIGAVMMKVIPILMAAALLIVLAAPLIVLAPILIPILIVAYLYKTFVK